MAKKPPVPDKLNICMVANKFPILGRASDHGFLWPVACGLAKRNHDVTILAWRNPQGKREISQDHIHAYYLAGKFARNSQDFPELVNLKFKELHNQKPFHIVHSIDDSGLEIGVHKKEYRVAMTYDVAATKMSQIFSILGLAHENLPSIIATGINVAYTFLKTYLGHDRHILNSADGMFVTSPQQRLALERHYLFPDFRTYSVPYGIEIGDLSPRQRSEELRQHLKLPGNAQTLVTISDMTEINVMKNLLNAFLNVAIKKPNSRLIILGDGPKKKEIEWEMLNLALGQKVIFAGDIPPQEIADYIALSDVFVNLSARTTGFEPSLLEAMAQKKVIIGSEVSPISTIVEDSVDGFLIRPADISSLTHLLLQIFTGQIETLEIGERARQKVIDIFDTDNMVEQTISAYYKTLKNCGYYS